MNTLICLGDMHANALKMVIQLEQLGFIDMTVDQYAQLTYAYYSNDVQDFYHGVQSLSFCKERIHTASICYLGDMLSDRGVNDAFILFLVHRMRQEGVQFDILFSNHDAWFFNHYTSFIQGFYSVALWSNDEKQNLSLRNFHHSLLKNELQVDDKAQPDTVNEMLMSYLSSVVLLKYVVDTNNKGYLLSHAPLNDDNIASIFNNRDLSLHHQINDHVKHWNTSWMNTLKNMGYSTDINECDNEQVKINKSFLFDFVWSRTITPKSHPLFTYVHGHDKGKFGYSRSLAGHSINLDNLTGKFDTDINNPLVPSMSFDAEIFRISLLHPFTQQFSVEKSKTANDILEKFFITDRWVGYRDPASKDLILRLMDQCRLDVALYFTVACMRPSRLDHWSQFAKVFFEDTRYYQNLYSKALQCVQAICKNVGKPSDIERFLNKTDLLSIDISLFTVLMLADFTPEKMYHVLCDSNLQSALSLLNAFKSPALSERLYCVLIQSPPFLCSAFSEISTAIYLLSPYASNESPFDFKRFLTCIENILMIILDNIAIDYPLFSVFQKHHPSLFSRHSSDSQNRLTRSLQHNLLDDYIPVDYQHHPDVKVLLSLAKLLNERTPSAYVDFHNHMRDYPSYFKDKLIYTFLTGVTIFSLCCIITGANNDNGILSPQSDYIAPTFIALLSIPIAYGLSDYLLPTTQSSELLILSETLEYLIPYASNPNTEHTEPHTMP